VTGVTESWFCGQDGQIGMRIICVTFDCADPDRLVAFWSAALGSSRVAKRCVPRDPEGTKFLPGRTA
jgi:hypothetical protein